jgi:hypothetical protein
MHVGRTGGPRGREELSRTETDVAQLEEAARRVAEQVDRLRSERDLAAARLTAGTALAAEALRSRADRIRGWWRWTPPVTRWSERTPWPRSGAEDAG